jgi:hypothetical protein
VRSGRRMLTGLLAVSVHVSAACLTSTFHTCRLAHGSHPHCHDGSPAGGHSCGRSRAALGAGALAQGGCEPCPACLLAQVHKTPKIAAEARFRLEAAPLPHSLPAESPRRLTRLRRFLCRGPPALLS